MSLKEMRSRSWLLFRSNIWKFAGASILIYLLTECAVMIIRYSVIFLPMASYFIKWEGITRNLVHAIFFPIAGMGFATVCIALWQGEKPSIKLLFSHCKKEKYRKALAVSLIYHGIFSIQIVLNQVAGIFIRSSSILGTYSQLAVQIIFLWVTLRLILVPVFYAMNPSIHVIKSSWKSMRGNITKYISLTFPFYGLAVIVLAVLYLLLPPFYKTLLMGIVVAGFRPLIVTATVGFANHYLGGQNGIHTTSHSNLT